MNILKLIPSSGSSLTVDSTLITVDSTTITVDATTNSVSGFTFYITTREVVDECEMIFYNELRETTETVIGTCSEYRGTLKIEFNLVDVIEADSFQLTINDMDGNLLYRGKAFATNQTDLENYSMTKPNQNNIIII